MLKRIFLIASVAVQTLRANPLHTLLSTLGLVVGVAALVAILSLGDGLELYARNQISTTTSLEAIMVQPKTRTTVNGVSLAIKSIPSLQVADAQALSDTLGPAASLALRKGINVLIKVPQDTLSAGAYLEATQPEMFTIIRAELEAGRFFNADDTLASKPVLVLNYALALRLLQPGGQLNNLIGQLLVVEETQAEVVGILKGSAEDKTPMAYGPFDAWSVSLQNNTPAGLLIRAQIVENVPDIKASVEAWLDTFSGEGREAFSIDTHQARVEQLRKAIKVFKIVMGLITGISVLVGGIGIMNVLLIAITERTREIGIRKATGARKIDIVLQFLTESVTISVTGSLFGIVLGLTTLAIAIPIIKNVAEVPFEMAFSASSLTIILAVALLVGIGFGTYPAWRAANLSPVDAIRHE